MRSGFVLALALPLVACSLDEVPDPSPAACPGTSVSVLLDGIPLCFTDAGSTMTSSGADALHLSVYGVRNPTPRVEDSGDGFSVELVLDRAALLATGATTAAIAGRTEFQAAADTFLLATQVHTASAAQSPLIRHVSIRRSCYCSQYGPADQDLHGRLELTDVSAQRVRGSLRLDVEGQVPFWNGGSGLVTPEVALELETSFDLSMP